MNIKCSVWCILLLLAGSIQAQVSITLQVPPVGVVQKPQLWNMVLVNGSNASYNAEVTITLLNTADNVPVMTATGRMVTLAKGARQLKYADFTPVNYKYLSAVFNGDLRPEGFLPAGAYTVCYTVSRWISDYTEVMAEECINLEIQPLSPPVLNTPYDGEVLDVRTPQFTWLPPSPVQLLGDLNYDIVITRLGTGQNPVSAVQQNMPVYNAGRYRKNFLNYPASAAVLDTGVTYAWCVVAKNSNQVIAQSDVWTFHVNGNNRPVTQPVAAAYVELQRAESAGAAVCVGNVNIAYTNNALDTSVHYLLRSIEEGKNQVLSEGRFLVNSGNNFLTLPPAVLKQLQNEKHYLLELVNSRNEKWLGKILYYTTKR